VRERELGGGGQRASADYSRHHPGTRLAELRKPAKTSARIAALRSRFEPGISNELNESNKEKNYNVNE
jgi:hypothetical protein